MKKSKLFALLSLGFLSLGGLCLGLKGPSHSLPVKAEEAVVEPEPEIFECSVVVVESKNGTVTADKLEGHIGDTVTLHVKHDVFYLIKSVSVNGTELVESEEVSGQYSFNLVKGENKIEAKFVIDEELLGEMSVIMEQAKNKDWANLFSVENIIRIVSFILNSGILLAIIRVYIKDKKLADKVEKGAERAVAKVVPEATKEIVCTTIKEFITPIFTELKIGTEDMKGALTVFSRCLALAQENTPEAKIAITKELSSLKLSDQVSINEVQKKIEDFVAKQNEKLTDVLSKLSKMEESNKKIISETPVKEVESEIEKEIEAERATVSEIHPYE